MSMPDFSHQNLRSRSFNGQNLRGLLFSHARCGVSTSRAVLNLLASAFIGVVVGVFLLVGAFYSLLFTKPIFGELSTSPDSAWLLGITALLSMAYCGVGWLFFYRGLIPALVGLVVIAVAVAVEVAVAVAAAVAAAAAGAGAAAGAAAGAVYVIFGGFLAWRAVWKEDPPLAFMRQIALNVRCWGGTDFSRADLSATDFSHAKLRKTRFTAATLTRANFQQAENLKFAYLKDTILDHRAVRELCVTANGERQNYAGLDLSGAYLKDANLQHANLSQASLLGADLRNAKLTGAKIGNWLIDTQTLLDGIECDYVYLQDNKRQPPEGCFKPGEFTDLFKQVAKALEFIVKDRLELEALLRAAKKLNQEENAQLELSSIENKQGSAKVTFTAPPDFERDELYAAMKREHDTQIKLLQTEYNAKMLGYEARITDFKDMFRMETQRPINPLNIKTEYQNMPDQRTQTITGSTIIGSTLNLGEISGRVQNSVHQLPADNPAQSSLKETLQRLHDLLNNANELGNDDKAGALEQLEKLTAAAQDPAAGQGIAKTALRFFKGLADDFKNAQDLAAELLALTKQIGAFFKL